MEVVVSSWGEAQGEDHMVALALADASFQGDLLGQEVQEQLMEAAYLEEVEVGDDVIFLGVIHQVVKLEAEWVQVLEAVALEGVAVEPF